MTNFFISLGLTLFAMQAQPIRVVVDITSPGTSIYANVLDHSRNLIKAFAPEKVEIEVVCHGAAIAMLIKPSGKLGPQMKALQSRGVVFAACANTMRKMHLDKQRLISGAVVVPSGVAEVVRKEQQGWAYLKG